MENKEIYIDGVDVSGCECIIEDYQRANNFEGRYEHIKNVCELGERGAEYYNLFCKDNPNCYYKQLKHKEQECEAYKMEADEGKEINAELKAENEELTTINARLLGRLEVDETDTSLVFNLDKELRQKEKEFYTAIQKVVTLKQTLTEIKEIVFPKNQLIITDSPIILKIQEIISEVEDG